MAINLALTRTIRLEQGSMLHMSTQYSAIFSDFRRVKIGVFLKIQCYNQIFAQTSSSLSKKRRFSAKKLRKYF
jgi:hypothetical protein